MALVTKHIFIEGRVQGVGFRRYVFEQAQMLCLEGWVQNLANGNVQVCVQGESEVLIEFLVLVERGPEVAQVTKLIEEEVQVEEAFQGFEIRY